MLKSSDGFTILTHLIFHKQLLSFIECTVNVVSIYFQKFRLHRLILTFSLDETAYQIKAIIGSQNQVAFFPSLGVDMLFINLFQNQIKSIEVIKL